MTEAEPKKFSLAWLGYVLLVLGFLEFALFLLLDKDALVSSIYTYYQSDFYTPLSHGKLPWVDFRFEYPPLAAYALMFPAFAPGLSVLWVSVLRGISTLVLSLLSLRFLGQSDRIPSKIRSLTGFSVGLMAAVVPGFYFGLFDWTLVLGNLLMALFLFGFSEDSKALKRFWPMVFVGASVKLMPLLAAPFLIQVKQLREKSNVWLSLGMTALIHLPFVAFGYHNFRVFLAYHRLRSIDCFSSYACVLNALEQLGKVTIVRKWAYGAIEVQGSTSAFFAKLSFPLFVVFLALLILVTRNLIKKGHGAKSAFGMYLVAFLAYPAISKVSQHNYCVWTVASIVCFWLIGFQRKDFVHKTFASLLIILLIGWFQDRYYVAFTYSLVPWNMIIVSSVRQILTLMLSAYCFTEILRGSSEEAAAPLRA